MAILAAEGPVTIFSPGAEDVNWWRKPLAKFPPST